MARAAKKAETATKKAAPAAKVKTEVEIMELSEGEVTFYLLGTSPLIFNRMAEKAKRSLLMGSTRKNAAERASSVKHNPPAEYRDSVYRNVGDRVETRLRFPVSAMKGSIKTAALDMPGATKSGVGRRIWLPGLSVDIYGVPKLLMSVVRSADIARVPDIRTRAIVENWCCKVTIRYAEPLMTAKQIARLFAAGGILCGVGDWRQEKGSGSFGQFRLCKPTDAPYVKIMKEGGRAAQDTALERAEPFDEESRELLDFFHEEIARRGREKDIPGEGDEVDNGVELEVETA